MLLRYPVLYLYFLRFAFSRAMEFRFDFFFRIVMDIVYYVVTFAFFGVLYLHTSLLGGWTLDQTFVFTAGFIFCDAIYMTVFSTGIWHFPFRINKGDLDYYLVRPVSSIFVLTLREFAANSFLNLLIAAGVLVWAIARYPDPLGFLPVAVFVVMVFLGCITFSLISVCFLIPTFWTTGHEGLRKLLYLVSDFSERPHTIYPAWIQRIVLTILPCALISSYPTWILFEGITPARIGHVLLVFTGTVAFTLWFWSRGLKAYSSASS